MSNSKRENVKVAGWHSKSIKPTQRSLRHQISFLTWPAVLLCRCIFFFTDRFYAEHKVNHVAYPYDGKYDARHPDVFSSHYEKTYAHQQCNRRKDRRLSPHCHAFFLDERIQMLLIHVCAYKPIVQLLRWIGKEEHRQQEKRHRRKYRQYYTYAA